MHWHFPQSDPAGTAFKQAVGWAGLQRFVTAASRASMQRMERYRFPDAAQLEKNPIRVAAHLGTERVSAAMAPVMWLPLR